MAKSAAVTKNSGRISFGHEGAQVSFKALGGLTEDLRISLDDGQR